MMYRHALTRAQTRSRPRETDLPPQRDPPHIVLASERVCVGGAGKTSERMIRNEDAKEAKVVTNFNQFAGIMA
jgi:hypothetical protein